MVWMTAGVVTTAEGVVTGADLLAIGAGVVTTAAELVGVGEVVPEVVALPHPVAIIPNITTATRNFFI